MATMTIDEHGFHTVPGTRVSNMYSQNSRPAPKISGMDLYRDMTDGAAPLIMSKTRAITPVSIMMKVKIPSYVTIVITSLSGATVRRVVRFILRNKSALL